MDDDERKTPLPEMEPTPSSEVNEETNVNDHVEIKLSRARRILDKSKEFIKNISVEPAVFLFTVAMSMNGISTTSLILRKFCLNQMNYPDEICRDLTSNKTLEEEAQTLATDFLLYKTLLESIPTVILSLFIGPWSDKNGRKLLLTLPSIGGSLGMIIMIFNAYYISQLNVYYIMLASVPYALGGNTLSVMTGAVSYIADATNTRTRTVRLGFIQASYLCGLPLGVAGGGALFEHYSYLTVFVASASLYVVAIVYVLLLVRETVHSAITRKNCCSLLNVRNVKEGLKTLFVNREHNGRLHLILLITAAAVSFLPLYAEYNVTYLYVRRKFQWDEATYSYYSTCVFIVCLIGLLFCMPIMSLQFKMKDLSIGILSALSKMLSELIIAISPKGWMLFAATPILIVSGMNSTIIRTVMSKIVSPEDQGKIIALMSASEAAVPILGSLLFTQVYKVTLYDFAGAIFFMSAALAVIPAVIFGWLYAQRISLPDYQRYDIINNS